MDLPEPDQNLLSLLSQTRYGLAAVLLATLWTLETIAPMFPGRHRRFSHGAANIGMAAVNTAVAFVAAFALLHVTQWSRQEHFGLLHRVATPGWLQWVGAIVLVDCWQYWWHRINHRVPLLWRFHAVHHADAELDATSGVRFHTIEIVFSMLARLVVLPLLGVTIPQLVLYETLSLPVILFHHSNVRLGANVDRALRWLIVTPWMHWVHHSDWRPETDSNYSSFLSVWDRVFRSFRLRHRPQDIHLGLANWPPSDWRGLGGMLTAPFRRRHGAEQEVDL